MKVWVFKCLIRRSRNSSYMWMSSTFPHITFVCEAFDIVEADKKFQSAIGIDPCEKSSLFTVLRHHSGMCNETNCRCKLPLSIAVSY